MLPLALSISSTESVSANANLNDIRLENFTSEAFDLHFKAVMFESDSANLHSVILEELPDVGLLELHGIVPDVNFVLSPRNLQYFIFFQL